MKIPILLKEDLRNFYDKLLIDSEHLNEGYLYLEYIGDKTKKCILKIKTPNGNQSFTIYDPSYKKTQKIIPLCYGNALYIFDIFEQVSGISYKRIMSSCKEVVLINHLSPWLYPNTYCNFNEKSKCVQYANVIAEKCKSDKEKVDEFSKWCMDIIQYDHELAKRVSTTEKWWLPDPDEVIETGKSICFGYASLFAALNRIVDIPCKIVIGQVKGTGLHAWNEVYLDGKWTRQYDLTFLDLANQNNEIVDFINDDSNYSMEYCG